MEGKITYHQQVSYCGKPRCRRCREGIGHGPYWYAYKTVNGRTVRTYVGKDLPPELIQAGEAGNVVTGETSRETVTETANALVRLYVLGQFSLERRHGQRWQTVTDATLQHQRVRWLLTCLVSSPGRKLGREQAIEMLWPELDFETASHRLDKAVHSLRQLFEPSRSRPSTSDLLLTEHQTLQLAEQSQFWIDADAFETLLSLARASTDPGKTEQLLEEAMLLYTGDYLPDEQEVSWAQTRRESLQRSWIGLLLELADLRIAREAYPEAIDILDRLLAIDPTNEAAVQRLILLLAQMGRRGEALRIYQRFATILKQEYKMAPLPETRALYEAAQRGQNLSAVLSNRANLAGESASQRAPQEKAADSEAHSYMQIGRSNQSRLVGREKELATLQQLLHATEQVKRLKLAGQKKPSVIAPLSPEARQRPQCIMLMGDVGIGKTRLAEELGREARRRGWTVTWTRAYAQEMSIPYRMWTETLRKAMSQGLWQRQEIARRPLIYQPLRNLLPELEDLLPASVSLAPTPADQEQLRLWEATRTLLATISENTPLLIVLDDMQWADSSSCEMLTYLVRQLRNTPIMIVCTCRDIELAPNHPLRSMMNDLHREQAIETVSVQPLTDEQIRALVSYLPEPAVRHIQAHAAGNPFFAEELARDIDTRLSSAEVDASSLVSEPVAPTQRTPGASLPLPDTIAAVLDLRLGRISTACQRLLVRAAVLGGSFEFQTLRSMESSGNLDEDTMLDLLEEALQAGMLTEEGSGTRITYHFWHPLLVSHLYEGLSAVRRSSLHRRAANVLEQTYAGREEEGAAVIVYHLAKGGADSPRIAHYAELAGDRAYALSAYPEAVRHYRLAIDHLGALSLNATTEERLHLANLLERLGECTRVQGKYEEARTYFEQALEIRNPLHLMPSNLDPQYEAQIDALLWVEVGKTWFDTGNFDEAWRCYELAEQVLNEAKVLVSPAWSSINLQKSYVLWRKGNFELARQNSLQALHILNNFLQDQEHDKNSVHLTSIRRTLQGDPVDLGRIHLLLGTVASVVGQNKEALEHLEAALTFFEQFDRQREIAMVSCNIGDLYLRKTDYVKAQAAIRRAVSIAERIGETSITCVGLGNLGVIAARLGDLPQSEIYFNQGVQLAEQASDPVYVSALQSYLISVVQDQGKFEQARSSIYHTLKIGREIDFTPAVSLALISLGNIRISQALFVRMKLNYSNIIQHNNRKSFAHFLRHAQITLKRALALEGLEAETRTEGQLALAQVSFLSGALDVAMQQVQQVMEEARQLEQTWLLAVAQRLMGCILEEQGRYDSAILYFEQSLETLYNCGMRLEWARTLRSYGESLLKHSRPGVNGYQKGIQNLQEARRTFQDCNAILDLQQTDSLLSSYTIASRRQR
jgi:DNA-binding SARP family transcriptional activator/predicted negative regulator of RcsB-dependent stress response